MLQPDPDAPRNLDFVISESTYGGRDRFERSEEGRRQILASAVNDAAARDGALLVPSFAVERTQEIVTDLVLLMERGTIPKAQIFIDSPLASKATEIFVRYSQTMQHGDDLGRAFASDFVKATESVDESKSLTRLKGFRIIVAASGMCDAGRIRHHLKNHLWEASTTVLLAGFQAEGSLGRILQEGAQMVTIMGEQIEVKAAIRQIEDYSGHADGPELVEWVKRRQPIARTVFITHGEEESQIALASDLEEIGVAPNCIVRPRLDDVYDLSGETCVLVSDAITPRIDPAAMGKRDANNELQGLLADIRHRLDRSDEASKATILQRLRRALDGENSHDSHNARGPRNKPPSQGQGFDEG